MQIRGVALLLCRVEKVTCWLLGSKIGSPLGLVAFATCCGVAWLLAVISYRLVCRLPVLQVGLAISRIVRPLLGSRVGGVRCATS